MKQTYRVLAGLIALGVLVQAANVAFGWFDALSAVDAGTVIDADYEGNLGHALHGTVGMTVIPLLGLILVIVSFFTTGSVPQGRTWAGIVFGLIVPRSLSRWPRSPRRSSGRSTGSTPWSSSAPRGGRAR